MMTRGFKILKAATEERDELIRQVEEHLGYGLPNLFRLFMECFELGDSNLDWQEFIHPDNGFKYPCVSIKFEPLEDTEELFFNGFFSASELMKDWTVYSKESLEFKDFGLLRIGDIGVGGGLFLGVKGANKDKIFRVVWDWDENYELLADNVFQFVKGIVFVEDGSNMGEFTYSQLYKRWREDFWRITTNT